MDIINNKIEQLKKLQDSVNAFENAITNIEIEIDKAAAVFDGVEGKTLCAVAKQYRKRVEMARKALRGEMRKKSGGLNDATH